MSELKAKRVMFGHVAGLAQALAHPLRIEIVDLLAQAPRSETPSQR
jgi:DNA-binding transcriptional ArsR family regulator